MYCGKGMELASAGCADCCSDCASAAPTCCAATGCCDAACCDTDCQLPPDPVNYEYHEPEENFVSIDDAKIKSLLFEIGQQQQELRRQQQEQKQQTEQQPQPQPQPQPQQQIIELLDDDEGSVGPPPLMLISTARSLKSEKRPMTDKQRLAKKLKQRHHRIVARIELSDSESENGDAEQTAKEKNSEDLPAANVSCELEEPTDQVIELPSDDEEKQPMKSATRKRSPRPYIKRRGRHFYQCQACGKKVQSNYNLRRHMMIHTGERPFPCDLCERRFREFSDLKKHRRRHINDPRYICMICRIHTPMEQDSTRCVECEGKNLLLAPQDCDALDADKEPIDETEPALDEQDEQEEQEEEQDTDQEFLPEDNQVENEVVSLPMPTLPPTLLVTLVPAPPPLTPAPPAPPAITLTALTRPPLPRSCSSANSSSSLSNDVAPKRPARVTRNRRTYPCPLCQRPFGTRHNLKRHYMIHTGEKPFSCSKCRKPFRECSTLKKHMVTHMRDRWYKCLRCPAKYQDYLHYMEHKATHGLDAQSETGARGRNRQISPDSGDGDSSLDDWLECCECQLRFTQLDAYTEHMKQHDLELYGLSVDDLDEEDQDVDVA
ncbi:myeloid zinc finger 1 isoform X1 [Drosophila navojoa]|uniref:myeloid zinc finger 1 isoform X1 n=1 Tax=Drosophila navojoa TaxID=7232 RepID=UPI0011BD7548|nr:myeloid zinc finger 1 isoform X1 [Drosophila navojoa]